MKRDILMLIIGAGISFISSIGALIFERLYSKKGKIKVYYRFSYVDTWGSKGWGFKSQTGETALIIPINFELQNTSNYTRVIRDVSLSLYNGDSFVCKMTEINDSRIKHYHGSELTGEEVIEYGNTNSSYSFVLPKTSIQKYKCEYVKKISNSEIANYQFNCIVLSYYDEKDKKKEFVIKEIDGNWKDCTYKPEIDWELAKN